MAIIDKDSDLEKNQVLRRYLDLAKFVDLLRTKKLYFRRSDLLEDKFEGSFTPKLDAAIREAYTTSANTEAYETFRKSFRRCTYINCWTQSLDDNMALWKLYGQSNNSVAITTTVHKLENELAKLKKDECCYIYKVEYINHWRHEHMDILPINKVFKYKLKAYEYEKEIRVIRYREANSKLIETSEIDHGIYMEVELNNFLRSIVVSPESEPWFLKVVEDLVVKYGLNVPVKNSMMSKNPY